MPTTIPTRAAWVPVAPIKRFITTKPVPITLHDKKYVGFLDTKGRPNIVSDVCTHRGAALSGGTVRDGCVRCPYHDHPTRGDPRRCVVANDVVWYDDDFDRDAPGPADLLELRQSHVHTYLRSFEGCNPLLILENTLDHAHLEHIHAITAVNGAPRVEVLDDHMVKYSYATLSPTIEIGVINEFRPWHTALRFFFNESHAFSLHFTWVPVGKQRTNCIVRIARADGDELSDKFLEILNELPLIEDRLVVRSIDAARAWSDDMLRPEDAFVSRFRDMMMTDRPETVGFYFDAEA